MTYKEEFITFMVRSGVLTFGDFTTKSGRKTPYFVNTGNYKTGAQAAKLGDYYAACIQEHMPEGITCLFGPAYKGIPLAVSAAASLYRNYDRDLPYCFNRKEAKDHGEGGSMVGYKPQDGDDVAIIEDVVTAGTAVRESIELFKHVAKVNMKALFVSVDRMERGTRDCSTLDELRQDYGIQVYPIVTVREVIAFLHNNPVDGKVYIDDEMKAKMEAYLAEYGAKASTYNPPSPWRAWGASGGNWSPLKMRCAKRICFSRRRKTRILNGGVPGRVRSQGLREPLIGGAGMNCPYCGGSMLEGTFHDRGDSYILPAGEVPPKLWTKAVLKKKHAILLPPESFGAVWAQRPSAFWCGICKKMLVDYGELMSQAEGQGTEGKE